MGHVEVPDMYPLVETEDVDATLKGIRHGHPSTPAGPDHPVGRPTSAAP